MRSQSQERLSVSSETEKFHGMDAIRQRIAERTASMRPGREHASYTVEDAMDEMGSAYLAGEAFVDDDGEVFAETANHFDDGKPDLSLLPRESLEEIARVLQFGAGKYGTYNWQKGMPWRKIAASLLRHVFAWLAGEDKDPESGISHIAHAGCNVVFLLWYIENEVGTDDRK